MESYRIDIFTSDVPGAGTTSRVFVSLIGKFGVTKPSALPGIYDRSTKVVNTVVDEQIGKIQKIEIGHDGSGARSAWHLAYVEVEVQSGPYRGTYTFFVNSWLRPRQHGEPSIVRVRALDPARRNVYKVIVRTGDGPDSGTRNKVSLRLKGQNGDMTEELDLSAEGRTCFQPGQTDVFFVDLGPRGLGKVASVDVGFKERNLAPDHPLMSDKWHVKSVTAVWLNTGEASEFEFNSVITHRGDTKLAKLQKFVAFKTRGAGRGAPVSMGGMDWAMREMSMTGRRHQFRVIVNTSDIRNAGTDAKVFVTVFGNCGNTATTFLPGEFERNTRVQLVFSDVDVGDVESIRVGHDGSGVHEGWHLSYVVVEDLSVQRIGSDGKPKTGTGPMIFFYNGWIKRPRAGEAAMITLDRLNKTRNVYKITVRTSDIDGAGTNKLVTLSLMGKKAGMTPEFALVADRNKFDRGSVDVFFLDLGGIRLGRIQGVDIGYRDVVTEDQLINWASAGVVDWHLASVTVEHMNSGKKYNFIYDDWVLNLKAKIEGLAPALFNPVTEHRLPLEALPSRRMFEHVEPIILPMDLEPIDVDRTLGTVTESIYEGASPLGITGRSAMPGGSMIGMSPSGRPLQLGPSGLNAVQTVDSWGRPITAGRTRRDYTESPDAHGIPGLSPPPYGAMSESPAPMPPPPSQPPASHVASAGTPDPREGESLSVASARRTPTAEPERPPIPETAPQLSAPAPPKPGKPAETPASLAALVIPPLKLKGPSAASLGLSLGLSLPKRPGKTQAVGSDAPPLTTSTSTGPDGPSIGGGIQAQRPTATASTGVGGDEPVADPEAAPAPSKEKEKKERRTKERAEASSVAVEVSESPAPDGPDAASSAPSAPKEEKKDKERRKKDKAAVSSSTAPEESPAPERSEGDATTSDSRQTREEKKARDKERRAKEKAASSAAGPEVSESPAPDADDPDTATSAPAKKEKRKKDKAAPAAPEEAASPSDAAATIASEPPSEAAPSKEKEKKERRKKTASVAAESETLPPAEPSIAAAGTSPSASGSAAIAAVSTGVGSDTPDAPAKEKERKKKTTVSSAVGSDMASAPEEAATVSTGVGGDAPDAAPKEKDRKKKASTSTTAVGSDLPPSPESASAGVSTAVGSDAPPPADKEKERKKRTVSSAVGADTASGPEEPGTVSTGVGSDAPPSKEKDKERRKKGVSQGVGVDSPAQGDAKPAAVSTGTGSDAPPPPPAERARSSSKAVASTATGTDGAVPSSESAAAAVSTGVGSDAPPSKEKDKERKKKGVSASVGADAPSGPGGFSTGVGSDAPAAVSTGVSTGVGSDGPPPPKEKDRKKKSSSTAVGTDPPAAPAATSATSASVGGDLPPRPDRKTGVSTATGTDSPAQPPPGVSAGVGVGTDLLPEQDGAVKSADAARKGVDSGVGASDKASVARGVVTTTQTDPDPAPAPAPAKASKKKAVPAPVEASFDTDALNISTVVKADDSSMQNDNLVPWSTKELNGAQRVAMWLASSAAVPLANYTSITNLGERPNELDSPGEGTTPVGYEGLSESAKRRYMDRGFSLKEYLGTGILIETTHERESSPQGSETSSDDFDIPIARASAASGTGQIRMSMGQQSNVAVRGSGMGGPRLSEAPPGRDSWGGSAAGPHYDSPSPAYRPSPSPAPSNPFRVADPGAAAAAAARGSTGGTAQAVVPGAPYVPSTRDSAGGTALPPNRGSVNGQSSLLLSAIPNLGMSAVSASEAVNDSRDTSALNTSRTLDQAPKIPISSAIRVDAAVGPDGVDFRPTRFWPRAATRISERDLSKSISDVLAEGLDLDLPPLTRDVAVGPGDDRPQSPYKDMRGQPVAPPAPPRARTQAPIRIATSKLTISPKTSSRFSIAQVMLNPDAAKKAPAPAAPRVTVGSSSGAAASDDPKAKMLGLMLGGAKAPPGNAAASAEAGKPGSGVPPPGLLFSPAARSRFMTAPGGSGAADTSNSVAPSPMGGASSTGQASPSVSAPTPRAVSKSRFTAGGAPSPSGSGNPMLSPGTPSVRDGGDNPTGSISPSVSNQQGGASPLPGVTPVSKFAIAKAMLTPRSSAPGGSPAPAASPSPAAAPAARSRVAIQSEAGAAKSATPPPGAMGLDRSRGPSTNGDAGRADREVSVLGPLPSRFNNLALNNWNADMGTMSDPARAVSLAFEATAGGSGGRPKPSLGRFLSWNQRGTDGPKNLLQRTSTFKREEDMPLKYSRFTVPKTLLLGLPDSKGATPRQPGQPGQEGEKKDEPRRATYS